MKSKHMSQLQGEFFSKAIKAGVSGEDALNTALLLSEAQAFAMLLLHFTVGDEAEGAASAAAVGGVSYQDALAAVHVLCEGEIENDAVPEKRLSTKRVTVYSILRSRGMSHREALEAAQSLPTENIDIFLAAIEAPVVSVEEALAAADIFVDEGQAHAYSEARAKHGLTHEQAFVFANIISNISFPLSEQEILEVARTLSMDQSAAYLKIMEFNDSHADALSIASGLSDGQAEVLTYLCENLGSDENLLDHVYNFSESQIAAFLAVMNSSNVSVEQALLISRLLSPEQAAAYAKARDNHVKHEDALILVQSFSNEQALAYVQALELAEESSEEEAQSDEAMSDSSENASDIDMDYVDADMYGCHISESGQ